MISGWIDNKHLLRMLDLLKIALLGHKEHKHSPESVKEQFLWHGSSICGGQG